MSNPSTPFPWKGDARRAGGWPKAKESEANLPRCAPPPSKGRRENAAFPASSFRAEARNLFRSRSGKSCEGSGERETPYASCDWGSRCFMQMDLRRKTANGKRKRSLGCARDDETRKRFPPIPFQSRAEANFRRYAPPPSRGRRENAAFPASSFRAEARNLFRSRSGKSCEGSGERETPYASCDWGSRCFMQMDLRRKTANGKRKRSLGCARDDETRKRFPPIPFQSRAEANLCPFGAPLSRGRRKKW